MLRYPQVCLAITSADNGNLRVRASGVLHTVSVSFGTGTNYKVNDRSNGPRDAIKVLADTIGAAVGVGVYSVEWDRAATGDRTLGYYRIRVSPAATVELLWDDPLTTLDPRLFGFRAATATSVALGDSGDAVIYSHWQAGRLCLPDRFARRPERWKRGGLRRTRRRPDSFKRVHTYDEGYSGHDVRWNRVHGLFIRRDAGERADYLGARRGVVLNDPNLSLQSILSAEPGTPDHDDRFPLVYYPDRSELDSYIEAVLDDDDDDFDFGDVASEVRPSPQAYNVRLSLAPWVETP